MDDAYAELPNEKLRADSVVDCACRDSGGQGHPPLVLLQYFRARRICSSL